MSEQLFLCYPLALTAICAHKVCILFLPILTMSMEILMKVVFQFILSTIYSNSWFYTFFFSLGDQFEVYNNTLVHDAVSMVPDLAVQGNILVRTSKGKLYTTDTKTAIQLTTESELNITVIPNYVQTTSEDLIYVIRAKGFGRSMLCHCHFNRSSKVASALFVFYSNRCEQRCHKTLNRSFFKYAMKNIIVQRDERYDNTVFAISDRTYPATVVFINISDSYIYSNEAQKQLYFNTINTTGGIRFSILPRYYTINPIKSSDMHLQSIVQNGETSYLVYGHSVYRMEMPSKYSLTEIPVKFLSGGKTRGYVDSHFHTAQYSLLMDIVIINETMLAIADIGNNRIRLLNLQTYTTSTLCWMPRLKEPEINYPNNDEQVVQKTCALEKPQSLQFINDSLYVAWKGGFGRVYDSQPSGNYYFTNL